MQHDITSIRLTKLESPCESVCTLLPLDRSDSVVEHKKNGIEKKLGRVQGMSVQEL